MAYTRITTTALAHNRSAWAVTHSLDTAKKMAKDFGHKIFKTPHGLYAVRKPTGKKLTPELRRKLEQSGQYDWR
jgi:hypothetical protein